MSDDLVFMMGNYSARIPADRLYADNHLWLLPEGDAFRVGFTAYSVRMLQDVYFLDWTIDPHTDVAHRREIGEIESSKALSTLYPPHAGTVLDFNPELSNDPSAINTDGYGTGWLYRFRTREPLLSPQEYFELLEAGWEETQRMLKGQIN